MKWVVVMGPVTIRMSTLKIQYIKVQTFQKTCAVVLAIAIFDYPVIQLLYYLKMLLRYLRGVCIPSAGPSIILNC